MAWWLTAVSGVKNILFGKSEGKGVIQQASDVVERWVPSTAKEHEMNIEQTKTEDASQDSARRMQLTATHEDWFNRVVDALNRLPRPLFTFWAFGLLTGFIKTPSHLNDMHPLALNIIWTIIGFFFGVRTLSQDLPKLIQTLRKK